MCSLNALVNGKRFKTGEVYDVSQVQYQGSVCEVTDLSGFIVAKYKGGTVLVFDRSWKFLGQCRDFFEFESGELLLSETEIECDEVYNLFKGEQMMLLSSEGDVVFNGVRGYMPLDEKVHFERFDDGGWRYCSADGSLKRKSSLRKVNVKVGKNAFMFDERGKMRLGLVNSHYPTSLAF